MTKKEKVIKRIRIVLKTYGSLGNPRKRVQHVGKLVAYILDLPKGKWENASLCQLEKFEHRLTVFLQLIL